LQRNAYMQQELRLYSTWLQKDTETLFYQQAAAAITREQVRGIRNNRKSR